MRLTVGEHSARYIRRVVRSHLRAWDLAELSDAVEPGATELVANVVRHGGKTVWFECRAECRGDDSG